MKPLCIYHGHCDDGFAAAWVVRTATGDTFDFFPGVYQQQPPDVTNRHVLLVDFSYKRPVLMEMATKAHSIVILDHHKTAAEDLSGFKEPAPFSELIHTWQALHGPDGVKRNENRGITALFDNTRCGAGLTYDFFFSNGLRLPFINYIEDRDLWRKSLPGGDEFTIALRSYPQDFAVWDKLVVAGPQALIDEGKSIQRYYRLRIEELKRSAYKTTIDGHTCWIANVPYFAASEVAGELCNCEDAEFGACYFEVRKGLWTYSLRSRDDFDVSKIASMFGGGGHKNSAGFAVNEPIHFTAEQ